MGIYEELGVRKVINGSATLTRLGGSLMPKVVLEAMLEAAQSFVDIVELQKKVGEEIARLTCNEAAYVSCGAAAGLVISTAACITGLDPEKRERLPHLEGMKNEVIVHKYGRVGYDYAIRQVGVKLVEIGRPEGTTAEEMEAAITDRTAAIFHFPNAYRDPVQLPMAEGIKIAKKHNVPFIVDAAAQLPPHTNLWHYTAELGADLSIFSGGKGLRGPQSSGLILGRKDLIEACAFNGPPSAFIGRGMKVGKEEMVGLLAAVKWYLSLDHEELMNTYERQVQFCIDEFSQIPHVTARRNFPSEAGQPMPRAEIIFDEEKLGITRNEIMRQLKEGEPSIEISGAGANGVFINPQTLNEGEECIIAERLKEVIGVKG
jgi:L-seryl-tRNA(Ser) seleniumtransferase